MKREALITPDLPGTQLEIVANGVLKSGTIALRSWRNDIAVHPKGFQEGIVTNADIQVDRFLIDFLGKQFPHEQIITEESYKPGIELSDSYFVIDSIDGTNHFARKLHDWAIAVSHINKGSVDLAVVYAPTVNELYVARPGQGAYKNGGRMAVSTRPKEEIGLQLGHDTIRFYDKTDIEERAAKGSRMLWITGSTSLALARLAAGQIELAVNMGQPVWDFSAGMLMIRESGGRFTNFEGGEEFDFSGRKTNNFVASNRQHHEFGLWIANGFIPKK